MAFNLKISGLLCGDRLFVGFDFHRHALRHEIFHIDAVEARCVIPEVKTQCQLTGLDVFRNRILVLIKTVFRLPDEGGSHLTVIFQHIHFDRLIFNRMAIAVAQQAVNYQSFPRTVQITRTKNEELFCIALRTGDIKLCQVKRRVFQVDHTGLAVINRQ